MRVLKSFYDPLTNKAYRRGATYDCSDKRHIEKLVSAGCIETPPITIPDENPTITIPEETVEVAQEDKKPKRKRGGKDGDSE